jgi:hypothetical protein
MQQVVGSSVTATRQACRATPMLGAARSRSLTAMPERLDRVTIRLDAGDITISWEARQALLARLFHANIKDRIIARGTSTDEILRAIEAVGATRPLELAEPQRLLLLHVLRTWSKNERWAPLV